LTLSGWNRENVAGSSDDALLFMCFGERDEFKGISFHSSGSKTVPHFTDTAWVFLLGPNEQGAIDAPLEMVEFHTQLEIMFQLDAFLLSYTPEPVTPIQSTREGAVLYRCRL
jgi:hypothetical protein